MSVRVFVMSCSRTGTAAAVLPQLMRASGIEVVGIFVNRAVLTPGQRRRLAWRKLRKVLSIGPLGAYNGIRMRRWYADAWRILGVRPLDEQAAELGIPYVEVQNLKDPRIKDSIVAWRCNLGLSLGNGFIPKSVFSLAPMGMLNIHHEVLPEFRGAQSVIWQLHEGSNMTGFTIHRIDEKIDTGAIVHVERMPIQFGASLAETVALTFAAQVRASGAALTEVLQDPARIEAAVPQEGGRHFTTPSFLQFLRIRRNHNRFRLAARSESVPMS